MRKLRGMVGTVSAGMFLAAGSAQAANPAFQDYFFSVCNTANNGALATRCSQTPGGLGDLSGDSESSLNPTQALSHNLTPLAAAQVRAKEARGKEAHERETTPGTRVDVGPFALLVHANATSFERQVGDDRERAFDGDSSGLELGFDYRATGNTVFGLIAGLGKTRFDFTAENAGVNFQPQALAGDNNTDTLYTSAFAAFTLGQSGFLDLAVGYERSGHTLRRNAVFQESTRTLTQTNVRVEGEADGDTRWAALSAGLNLGGGAFSAGIYGGLSYAESSLDGYTEQDLNNSGLAMSFESSTRESLQGHFGIRAGLTFSTASAVVMPQWRVEYAHDFQDKAPSVASRFVLDPDAVAFLLDGAERDTSTMEAGFGVAAVFANGWQPFLNVDVLLGSTDFDRTRVTLGVRVEL